MLLMLLMRSTSGFWIVAPLPRLGGDKSPVRQYPAVSA